MICRVGLLSPIRTEPGISFAREDPLGFRNLSILDSKSQRGDYRACRFFQQPEVSGLSRLGIEVTALYLSERFDGFPESRTGTPHDSILGLPESGRERRYRWFVSHHGVQVLVQRRFQTGTIARSGWCTEHSACHGREDKSST
jgi:hypothetical protein